jgi:hypothetical protein
MSVLEVPPLTAVSIPVAQKEPVPGTAMMPLAVPV